MTDVSPALDFVDSDGSQNYQIRLNSGILKFKDTTNGAERMQINADGHVDILGNLDVGSGLDVTGAITATGNLTITNSFPKIDLVKDSTSYQINNENGVFNIRQNGTTNKIQINSDGHVDITAHLDAEGGVDVTGNITVTGTVDGVDIATRDTLFGGLTASSGVLTNGVTATTQSASDSTTKVATTAFTQSAISNATITGSQISTNAIDSSKIADGAIVNADVNASAAIAGTKISPDFGSQNIVTTGGLTIAGDVLFDSTAGSDYDIQWTTSNGQLRIKDSSKLVFGTSGDVIAYHDDSDFYIHNTKGNSYLQNTGDVYIRTNNTENALKAIQNGAVELYHDSNKKFETTSGGVSVTGAITGTGDVTIDTSTFKVDSSNNRVGVGTASPTDLLDIHNSTSNSRVLRISHPSDPTNACAFIGYNTDGTGTTNNIVTFGIQTSSTYYNVLNIRRSTQTVGINKLVPTEALDVTGNIAVSGTVDGVDIAALNSTVSGKLSNIVEDTSPQLGGDLDMNSNFISNGVLGIKNTGSQSEVRLYCEVSNAHYAAIQAPSHSVFSGNVTLTLPAAAGSQSIVGTTETQTLTNKTLTSAVLNTGVSGSAILDEDNMASNSATKLATQQSIKAYVDATAGGGSGTVAGSNTQVQFNNNGSFGGSGNLTFDGTNLSVGGTVSGTSSASGTAGFRKITASTSAPSGGSDGDVWIKYTA